MLRSPANPFRCAAVMPEPSLSARRIRALRAGACALLGCMAAACDRGATDTAAAPKAGPAASTASGASGATTAAAAASAPPVSITTVVARRRDVPVLLEATGSAVPVSSVELRAQMTSVITRVHVKEGQFVRAGEPLFTLDARADEANVARLSAQLARNQAALADAQRQLARSRELQAQNFVSQGAVDSSQTLVEANTAAVAADRAAIDAARVTLAYSRIAAPGPGRVGAVNVFVGSSVQANVTPLLTITQIDPIDVAFAVPQRHLGELLAALKSGNAVVRASLPEAGGALDGQLQFVDNNVEAASGTVKAKARFANAQQQLWPGAFVRATLTVRTLEGAVVVPQAAIVQSPRGSIVYVVDGGRAAIRPVQVLAVQADEAAVDGLKGGEKIVLDGRQNLRPGAAVVERPREGSGSGPRRGKDGAGSAAGTGAGGVNSAASAAIGKGPAP
jgi:RND family efflux transporter MFP subunit